MHCSSEFPESLVSDSKCRDSRLKTRNRTRIRPRYFSFQSLGLGIGIEVPRYSRLKGGKCHYLWLFEGKQAESDSKFRDSRFRTRNRSRNRNRFFTMQGLGLGIGLGILTYRVSDSESGLENRDSGNSGMYMPINYTSSLHNGSTNGGSIKICVGESLFLECSLSSHKLQVRIALLFNDNSVPTKKRLVT